MRKKHLYRRLLALFLVTAMVLQVLGAFAGIASAAPTNTDNLAKNVVISQFYGGKKNDAEDLYSNDFVELYNPTAMPISLEGWSIQYADSGKNSWKVATLGTNTSQIPAYGYYLISLGSNEVAGQQTLPQPDASDDSFKLDNKSGKLALLNTTNSLSSNDPTKDQFSGDVIDFVGYAADAYLGTSSAPESGKKNTIQRFVFDPLNPDSSTTAKAFPQRGNNWDTRNNGADFEKVDGVARNSASTAAYAILENDQEVHMVSESEVDPDQNKIVLEAFGGSVKQGTWSTDDFTVVGLPSGLTVTASVYGDTIEISTAGEATEEINTDTELTFELNPTVWDQDNKPNDAVQVYQNNYTVKIIPFTPSNKIVAAPAAASSSVSMSGMKQLNADIRLVLTNGTVKDGELSPEAYQVSGLPDGDWSFTATGTSQDQTITISIAGTSSEPVMENGSLNVTLNAESVTESGWLASNAIDIPLLRYSQPIQTNEARKLQVIQSMIADNAFFNDAATKEYKYSDDAMGANEYTFLRGTNSLFKADLAAGFIPSPESVIDGWAERDILTYTQGDAHIQNVGTFNDSTLLMQFGLNDADSAGIGSFYEDLLRFVTSIYVVKYDEDSSGITNLQTSDLREAAGIFLEEYKDTVLAINSGESPKSTKLTKDNVTSYTKAVMDKVSKGTYEEALQKLLNKRAKDGKLNIEGNADKFEAASTSEIAMIQSQWEAYKAQVRDQFPNLDDEQFDAYFTIKDIVRRIHQGIGSIGTERYNVLIEGASEGNTDDILLDVKEQTRDANLSKDAAIKTAVDPDAYLGTIAASNRSYLIKEVTPYKGDYTDKSFTSLDELEQYLVDSARAHAYADSRQDMVSEELNYKFEERFATNVAPVWDELKAFILNAAEDYSKQIIADFDLVKDDMRAGKLIDVSTLDELSVNSGSLSPAFDPKVTKYTVTVEQSTNSIEVSAKATDTKAILSSQDSTNQQELHQTVALNIGTQQIPVTVTARNGSNKTYTISVTRKGSSGTTPSVPSGNSNSGGSTTNPSPENTGSIPVSGGSFHSNGVDITVPSGAFKTQSVIEVSKVNDFSEMFKDSQYRLLGDVYEISANPAGDLLKPVTITLPFDTSYSTSSLVPALYGWDASNKTWVLLDNQKFDPNGTVSGTTMQFTRFAVLISEMTEPLPEGGKDLADIKGHWAEEGIKELIALGAIQGYQDSTFRPEQSITRAEFVTILVQALGLQAASEASTFTDLNEHWAKASIATAVSLGIVNGVNTDEFMPNQQITREQMMTMIVRALPMGAEGDQLAFSDASTISDWARSALASAVEHGLVTGYADGTVKPKGKATRAEAATIILRALHMKVSEK